MTTIDIESLPALVFAHTFSTGSYNAVFAAVPNKIEISYITDGSLSFVCGGVTYTAVSGDIICNLHREASRVFTTSHHAHRTVAFEVCHVPKDGGLLLPPLLRSETVSEEVYRTIEDLIYLYNTKTGTRPREAKLILDLMCAIDGCTRLARADSVPSDILYAERAKTYVSHNLTLPLTQSGTAKALGISPGYLCSVFKKTQGMTFMRYVNKTKLEGVRSLMEHEGMSLRDASAAYGYGDPNYASRLYKSIFGHCVTAGDLLKYI